MSTYEIDPNVLFLRQPLDETKSRPIEAWLESGVSLELLEWRYGHEAVKAFLSNADNCEIADATPKPRGELDA